MVARKIDKTRPSLSTYAALTYAAPRAYVCATALRIAVPAVLGKRPIRAEILLVGRDPIASDFTLRLNQIEAAVTHHLAKAIFQCILDLSVPDRSRIRVRPKGVDFV